MKNYDKIETLLKKVRGHILSETVLVEIDLTIEIENYFFKRNNKKSRIFRNHILGSKKFTFNDKIDLFEVVLKVKKSKNKDQIMEDLRFIKKLRNFVAHGDMQRSKSTQKKIILCDIDNSKQLEINNKDIEKFNECICNFHKKICHSHFLSIEDFENIFA